MSDSPAPRFLDLGLLIARIGFGLGYVWFHGFPKIAGGAEAWAMYGGAMGNFGITFTPTLWGLAAALAETVGGLLIALGLFFRPAALALMVTMIVATVNHIATGMGSPAHSFKNAWLFLGLLFIGPGRYSLDQWLASRRVRSQADETEEAPETVV